MLGAGGYDLLADRNDAPVMTQFPLLSVAILLGVAALILFWIARRKQRQSGLPGSRLIYTDTQAWVRLEKPLFCQELSLTGKPDYLVEQNDQIIPVEVKSSRQLKSPYESHVFQLAAYCILVERSYGKRPAYGILHYPDQTFAIDFTPLLEAKVISLLAEMQAAAQAGQAERSHASAQRCSHCGYRDICDQALRI